MSPIWLVPRPAARGEAPADLVQEGRSLLPLYAAGWTDHNLHDPGITLMELFAWVTEMDLFRIDQVPPAHRLRFLALLGVTPRPAHGAELPVGLRLGAGAGPVEKSQQVRLGEPEPAVAGRLHALHEQIDPEAAGLPEAPADMVQQRRPPGVGPIEFVKLLDQIARSGY